MSEPKITIDAASWSRVVRERDEAREQVARLNGAYEDATNYYERMIDLIDERDKAREALAEEMKFHHRTHAELVQAQCQLQDAIRERDEARELAQQMSDSLQVLLADVRFYRNAWEQLKEATK